MVEFRRLEVGVVGDIPKPYFPKDRFHSGCRLGLGKFPGRSSCAPLRLRVLALSTVDWLVATLDLLDPVDPVLPELLVPLFREWVGAHCVR